MDGCHVKMKFDIGTSSLLPPTRPTRHLLKKYIRTRQQILRALLLGQNLAIKLVVI